MEMENFIFMLKKQINAGIYFYAQMCNLEQRKKITLNLKSA